MQCDAKNISQRDTKKAQRTRRKGLIDGQERTIKSEELRIKNGKSKK